MILKLLAGLLGVTNFLCNSLMNHVILIKSRRQMKTEQANVLVTPMTFEVWDCESHGDENPEVVLECNTKSEAESYIAGAVDNGRSPDAFCIQEIPSTTWNVQNFM